MTLRIAPGAPIDEDLIGRELEMGRTPVREAIKRLALENLVTVFPRRGTFASEINITDLAHISDVRAQLEGHAAYRAAERITDAQRAELSGLLEELQASRGTDDLESLMELDARVHRFIYRCAANPFLEETLGRYFNLSLRIWYLVIDRLPHLFARVHEHQDVLLAIAAGQADAGAGHGRRARRDVRARDPLGPLSASLAGSRTCATGSGLAARSPIDRDETAAGAGARCAQRGTPHAATRRRSGAGARPATRSTTRPRSDARTRRTSRCSARTAGRRR